MHPSALHVLIDALVNDHHINVVMDHDDPLFPVVQVAAACGSKDPAQFPKLIRADDEYLPDAHYLVFTGEKLAWFKARAHSGNSDTTVDRAPSATFFTLAGLSLFLTKTALPYGREVRRWLADEVMPTILKTGSYGQPQIEGPSPESKHATLSPTDVKLAIADRMLAANDKAGAKKVLRAAAVEVGVDFSRPKRIEAAPTAQLELPLPTVAAPAPAQPEPATKGKGKPRYVPKVPPNDGNDWTGLVRAWSAKYGVDVIVSPTDLLRLGIIVPRSHNDAGRASKLGKLLHMRIDTVIGGFKILHRHSTIRGYCLQAPL